MTTPQSSTVTAVKSIMDHGTQDPGRHPVHPPRRRRSCVHRRRDPAIFCC